jgi:hypothetical protein
MYALNQLHCANIDAFFIPLEKPKKHMRSGGMSHTGLTLDDQDMWATWHAQQ